MRQDVCVYLFIDAIPYTVADLIHIRPNNEYLNTVKVI